MSQYIPNKVVRQYELTGSCSGRPVAQTITLRYSEADAAVLPRDSQAAVAEAMAYAKRRNLIPTAPGAVVSIECVRESLRRDVRR